MIKFKNEKIKNVINIFKKQKINIFLMFILFIIQSFVSIISPKITSKIINTLSDPYFKYDFFLKNLINLSFIYLTFFISFCYSVFLMVKINAKTFYYLRKKLSQKLKKLNFETIENFELGEILTLFIFDVDNLVIGVTNNIIKFVPSLISIIGSMYMMMSINVTMSIAVFVISFFNFLFLTKIYHKINIYFRKNRKNISKINESFENICYMNSEIKSFCAQEIMNKKFKNLNKDYRDSEFKSSFFSGLLIPFINIIMNLNYILICILGSIMVIYSNVNIGDILAFLSYVNQFSNELPIVSSFYETFIKVMVSSEKIFNFLNLHEETNEKYENKIKNTKKFFEFKNISFKYKNNKNKVFDKFSCKINLNSITIIKGKSGIGKSTLFKILTGLYKLNEGECLFCEVNTNEIDPKVYRKNFSFVTQDPLLFEETIFENIRYANQNASKVEVINAALIANIHEIIMRKPQGYETIIDENFNNFSKSECQLISLARALCSKRKIILLDEAVSSVDLNTENSIYKKLEYIKKKSSEITIILISHQDIKSFESNSYLNL